MTRQLVTRSLNRPGAVVGSVSDPVFFPLFVRDGII